MNRLRQWLSAILLLVFAFTLVIKPIHLAGHAHHHHEHPECRITTPGLNYHEDHHDCPICSYEFAQEDLPSLVSESVSIQCIDLVLQEVLPAIPHLQSRDLLFLRGPPDLL
jgi:hypothetical protein